MRTSPQHNKKEDISRGCMLLVIPQRRDTENPQAPGFRLTCLTCTAIIVPDVMPGPKDSAAHHHQLDDQKKSRRLVRPRDVPTQLLL